MTEIRAVNRLESAIVKSNGGDKEAQSKTVQITPPKMQTAVFRIIGTAPLVIHRFSQKAKQAMIDKMKLGSKAKKGMQREALDPEQAFNDARYISKDGWDGFNVAAIRAGMISACRLVGFKMTLAKLTLFVEAEGRDAKEPQFGLIRILGCKARMQEDIVRLETGVACPAFRPAYDDWEAIVRLRFDTEQFDLADVTNLLSRVGEQVGLCEGRPDSKNSAGMGWGTFRVENEEDKRNENRCNR